MKFFYAKEKALFDQKWEKLRQEYEQAGMSKESIQSMYDFDLECFRAQRRYCNHVQLLSDGIFDGMESGADTVLKRKFDSMSCAFSEDDFSGRFDWTEAVSDPRMIKGLKQLSEEGLELLTYIVIEEHSQAELAQKWGCSQKAISKKLQKIRKMFQERF